MKTIGSAFYILHNICKDMGDPWAVDAQEPPEEEEERDDAGDANVPSGASVRNTLAQSLVINDE